MLPTSRSTNTSLPQSIDDIISDKQTKKLSRYKLAADASFKQKFEYVIFRIWNALKAIFNQSDWQQVRKEIVASITEPLLKNEGLKPITEMFKNHIPQITKVVEAGVDLFMCTGIDNKLESVVENPKKETLDSLKKPLFEEFKVHATKLGVNTQLFEPMLKMNNRLIPSHIETNKLPFTLELLSLLPKIEDGSIVPPLADFLKGAFKIVAKQDVISSTTRDSATRLVNLASKTLQQIFNDKALAQKAMTAFMPQMPTEGLSLFN